MKLTTIDKAKVAVVIPSRYASTRFPGKPLVEIAGVTMIERVYKQALQARNVGTVIVASDDARIIDHVRAFGGVALLTRDDHSTGTDRLAEIAEARPDVEIIVNVQGDEPLIDPAAIEAVVEPLLSEPGVQMATLAFPVADYSEIEQPTLVKVVCDSAGYALYFSRHPIPYCRNEAERESIKYFGHMGIYAYTRQCLLRIASLPPTPLEQAEKLEQLRALENGIRIRVNHWQNRTVGVDVPEDVAKVEKALTLSRV